MKGVRNIAVFCILVAVLAAASFLAGGCAGTTQTVQYPQKGKTLTIIVPFPAGGPTDLTSRILAPSLEKQLGIPVEVVNKAGAGAQVGLTELAQSKPDGYTISLVFPPGVSTLYMDPQRKAAFSRKDIVPVASQIVDPAAVYVKADSPYKDVKGLLDAAKAKPEQVKAGAGGILNPSHLVGIQLEKATGSHFAWVMFDGSAQSSAALLGGHIDAVFDSASSVMIQLKSGNVRVLGVTADYEFLPGIKTFEVQGFPAKMVTQRGYVAPGGTPKPIVDALATAIKKAMDDPEFKQRSKEAGQVLNYIGTQDYTTFWDQGEKEVADLMEFAGVKPVR